MSNPLPGGHVRRCARVLSLVLALAAALAIPVLAPPPARAEAAFRFDNANLEASETQPFVRVVVHRTDLPVSRVTVGYRTEAGTATPGSDYQETSGTLTFGVGESTASFIVSLRDDDVVEERETVLLRLLDSASTTATLTIIDDDVAPRSSAMRNPATAPPTPSPAPSPPPQRPAAPVVAAVTATPPAPPAARRPVVARRAATPPRRVEVRQSPVTPFELRPAPRAAAGPLAPGRVDPGVAVLAALLLARVAAEVWFRTRAHSV